MILIKLDTSIASDISDAQREFSFKWHKGLSFQPMPAPLYKLLYNAFSMFSDCSHFFPSILCDR